MSIQLDYVRFREWFLETTPDLLEDQYYLVCAFGKRQFQQIEFYDKLRAIDFACGLKFAEVYVWIEVKSDVVQFSDPDVLDG